MLKLKLAPDKRFMHDELSNCKAEIELSPASADYVPANPGTPDLETTDPSYVAPTDQVGDAAVKAEGVFHIINTGNAYDCVITARGIQDREAAAPVARPSAITATLTADFERTMVFTAGSCDTGIPVVTEDEFDNKIKVNGAAPTIVDTGATLVLTVSGLNGKATVSFEGIEVATGIGVDPLCDGSFSINPVGEIHVDAVCGWARPHDLKPNPTHLRIRGVNSHAKIFTLGVADGTDTAITSGE